MSLYNTLFMKKKILIPIMAIAMIVTAGVNFKMINGSVNETEMSLSSLLKTSIAWGWGSGESSEMCGFCGGTGCWACDDTGTVVNEKNGLITCTGEWGDEYQSDGCVSGGIICTSFGCW